MLLCFMNRFVVSVDGSALGMTVLCGRNAWIQYDQHTRGKAHQADDYIKKPKRFFMLSSHKLLIFHRGKTKHCDTANDA